MIQAAAPTTSKVQEEAAELVLDSSLSTRNQRTKRSRSPGGGGSSMPQEEDTNEYQSFPLLLLDVSSVLLDEESTTTATPPPPPTTATPPSDTKREKKKDDEGSSNPSPPNPNPPLRNMFSSGPMFRTGDITDAEQDDFRHPCLREFREGECPWGKKCCFALFPRDTCLAHVKTPNGQAGGSNCPGAKAAAAAFDEGKKWKKKNHKRNQKNRRVEEAEKQQEIPVQTTSGGAEEGEEVGQELERVNGITEPLDEDEQMKGRQRRAAAAEICRSNHRVLYYDTKGQMYHQEFSQLAVVPCYKCGKVVKVGDVEASFSTRGSGLVRYSCKKEVTEGMGGCAGSTDLFLLSQ